MVCPKSQGGTIMLDTEIRSLHFDLSHLPAGTNCWLSAGASDYPLTPHSEETRQDARRVNRALALVPADRITHYVKDIALPARSPQLLMVHSPSRTGGT